MDNQTRLHHLRNIFKNNILTYQEKIALESAIEILKNNATKEQLIEVAKILATLLTLSAKILHS